MNALVSALVYAYVAGEISAEEFKAWFIPITWDMSRFRSSEIADMVRDVQLLIMEFSSGDRTEENFKTQLGSLYNSRSRLVLLGPRPSRDALPSFTVESKSSHRQLHVVAGTGAA
jgi:hypothetical protein